MSWPGRETGDTMTKCSWPGGYWWKVRVSSVRGRGHQSAIRRRPIEINRLRLLVLVVAREIIDASNSRSAMTGQEVLVV